MHDDELIRSDKEMAVVLRRAIESHDRMIAQYRQDNEVLLAERNRLLDAIRRAGFAVCRTSGDWTLHDVSELGKAEEARSLAVATRNVDLEAQIARLQAEIAEAREACPCVRMQDHFEDTLLQAVQFTVSRMFQLEAERKQVAEAIETLLTSFDMEKSKHG